MTDTTDTRAKAAWLAEHLMRYQQMQRASDKGPWWEKAGGEPVAPVDHWDPDFPAWNPFDDIRQAKDVQAAMRARGYTFCLNHYVGWPFGAHFWRSHEYRIYSGEGDTEAAAICNAAGAALGWPFEEEEA